MGIAMEADTAFGESKGGLQAPHVFKEKDRFYMVYGNWQRICLASSRDGKAFTRVLNERGQPDLFTGPYENTRDPMVLKLGDLFYCYYMGHKKGAEYQSAIFCRTSRDLESWSEPTMVSAGGSAAAHTNWFGGDAECPFVVNKDGMFHLFRNQLYGRNNLNTQYASPNPLSFGVGDDRCRIGTLPVAAPEIVLHKGQWYIAALNPALDGIRIARLRWAKNSSGRTE
jgi:beta-xylosidase